ncbi:uncharacterized protein [Lepisosteus oculatus]|uniref:uncharacterized protein n=1 Tax=Lepisosteus oculatus TaxID=7918 RepID=UPI0035F50EE6
MQIHLVKYTLKPGYYSLNLCRIMTLFVLFHILMGLEVSPVWSDILLQPLIELDQEQIDIEDYARARCESDSGRQCHFYIDKSPNPFKSTPHSFGVCQLTVYASELLENKTRQDKMEIFLSCAVETQTGNQTFISKRSGVKKLEVFDKFGSLSIDVDMEQIKKETIITVRCETERGTRCHFYTDEGRAPFRTVPFREQFKVCLLLVSGWELLEQRGKGTGAEVSLSCAAELTTEGRSVSSGRSRAIRIQVESLEESQSTKNRTTDSKDFNTGLNLTETNFTSGSAPRPEFFIFLAAVVLPILVVIAVLISLSFKIKRRKQEREREMEEEGNNTIVYATIDKAATRTTTQLQEREADVCYATVKAKLPKKQTTVVELNLKSEYATVKMH